MDSDAGDEATQTGHAERVGRHRQLEIRALVTALAAAYGIVALRSAILVGIAAPMDFSWMLTAAARWSAGGEMYAIQTDNLNPPLATFLLFRPWLGHTLTEAYIGWSIVNVAIVLLLSRWSQRPLLALAMLVTTSVLVNIRVGQVGLVLALLVALAWRADQDRRPLAAGTWLGVALCWKPFVGLILVWWLWRREWAASAVAVLTAGAVSGAQILLWGWPLYSNWLEAVQAVGVRHLSSELNLSVFGFAARSGWAWIGPILATAVAVTTALRVRRASISEGWTRLLAASLLLSPLGWSYYLPIIFLPALAWWNSSGSRWLGSCGLALTVTPTLWAEPSMLVMLGIALV